MQIRSIAVDADAGLLEAGLQLAASLPPLPRNAKHTSPKPLSTAKRKRIRLTGVKLEVLDMSLQYSAALQAPQHLYRPSDSAPSAGRQECAARLTLGRITGEVDASFAKLLAEVQALKLEHVQTGSRPWSDGLQAQLDPAELLRLPTATVTVAKAPAAALNRISLTDDAVPSVDAQLSSLQLGFEADHLFAALGITSEILQLCKPRSASAASAQLPSDQQQQQQQQQHDVSQQAPSSSRKTAHKLWPVPVRVTAGLLDVSCHAHFMDKLLWGFSSASALVTASPSTLPAASLLGLGVSLNGQSLVHCGAVSASLLAVNLQEDGTARKPAAALQSADTSTPAAAQLATALRRASGSCASSTASPRSVVQDSSASRALIRHDSAAERRPYSGSADSVTQAYCRAGIALGWASPYAEPPAVYDSTSSTQAQEQQQQNSESALPPPLVSVQACLRDVDISLPYGCELGMAIRGSELWAKGFQLALKEQLQHLLQSPQRRRSQSAAQVTPDAGAQHRPIELLVSLQGCSFRFEQHPMEVMHFLWHACHASIVQPRAWQLDLARHTP